MKKLILIVAIPVALLITVPAVGFMLVLMIAALGVGVFGMICSLILSIRWSKTKTSKDYYKPEKELGI